MKQTILHIIPSLGRGGAETMLIHVLKELKEYNNIVITLQSYNHFENELICDRLICLHEPQFRSIPFASIKLRRIIKKYKPDLVHSHLPLSNFVARLAVPTGVPLVTTIHSSIAKIPEYNKWYFRLLDKLTYKYKKSTLLAVSEEAKKDYLGVLNLPDEKMHVLYTFVTLSQSGIQPSRFSDGCFKMVSVGSLRHVKNYSFLIEAFSKLQNENIELSIYGEGPLKENLQDAINQSKAKVTLEGQVKNIPEILSQYDLFVMASLYEGFSVGVLEAMATHIPLFLSNIPSFKEQCEDSAFYFDLKKVDDFIENLKTIISNKAAVSEKKEKAFQRVIDNFTITHHMKGLRNIYKNLIKK